MKAYSVDLREKIVAAVGHGMSKAQAARTFGVGATSVKRYVTLAEQGKPLSPGKAPGKKSKLDESGVKLLEEDLRSRPAVTYKKGADLLYELRERCWRVLRAWWLPSTRPSSTKRAVGS